MRGENENGGRRIRGRALEISDGSIRKFFTDRARRYDPARELTAVLYQDSRPELAARRDEEEKALLLPMMSLAPTDRVLDLGCGIGRWAATIAPLVGAYHGLDFTAEFIEVAREKCRGVPSATFQAMAVQDITQDNLETPGPYSLVLISGLLAYLNDAEVARLFQVLNRCTGSASRVFVREPVGIQGRLTLDRIWSDELHCEYSAIYRTREQIEECIAGLHGSRIVCSRSLYTADLNRRRETIHHLFVVTIYKGRR